jgi:hypothetical protein
LYFQAFPVNAEVDSLHLNKVYLNARGKHGGAFLAKLMSETPIEYYDKKRKPKELNFSSGKALSPEALVHAVQDCRLPLAGISMIVERYCRAYRIPDERNVLPTIHHFLTR